MVCKYRSGRFSLDPVPDPRQSLRLTAVETLQIHDIDKKQGCCPAVRWNPKMHQTCLVRTDVDEIKDKSKDEDVDESEDEEKDNDVDDDDVQREGTRTGIRHAPFGRDQNPLFALFALYST